MKLEIKNIKKSFGKREVLSDITFTAEGDGVTQTVLKSMLTDMSYERVETDQRPNRIHISIRA